MKNHPGKSLLIVCTVFVLFSFSGEKKNLTAPTIENSVVRISDSLYAGQCEVSNWFYRQFLNDLAEKKRIDELKLAEIDSTGWLSGPVYIESFVMLYHRDEKFNDYPVVNVSYEAANLFCTWLTDKYNSCPGRKFKKATFRLPSGPEWMMAAKGNQINPVYATGNSLKNENGIPKANYRRTDIPVSKENPLNDNADILTPVKSYWKNNFGMYNLNGNAAEMISQKGITKGGSYRNTSDELKIESKGTYQKPSSDIGFRYFMQIENH